MRKDLTQRTGATPAPRRRGQSPRRLLSFRQERLFPKRYANPLWADARSSWVEAGELKNGIKRVHWGPDPKGGRTMSKTLMRRSAIALAFSASMGAGCATTDPTTGEQTPNRMATGAIIGAIGGAATGAMAGGDDGRNAAVGAVVGAIAGGAVGAYMDRQERALREQLAGTGVAVERVAADQIRLVMPSDITFDTAAATVRGQFLPILMDVSSVLEANPATMIDVIGHADSRGAEAYNLDLSERRAFAVSSVLIQNGVQRERILAYGRGELEPIADNTTPQGQQLNRRVEIRVRAVTQG